MASLGILNVFNQTHYAEINAIAHILMTGNGRRIFQNIYSSVDYASFKRTYFDFDLAADKEFDSYKTYMNRRENFEFPNVYKRIGAKGVPAFATESGLCRTHFYQTRLLMDAYLWKQNNVSWMGTDFHVIFGSKKINFSVTLSILGNNL